MAISRIARERKRMTNGWLRLALASAIAALLAMQAGWISAESAAAPSAGASESAAPATKGHAEAAAVKIPSLAAESAILIDGRSGTVLYGKNETERLYPASITKIVTAIVALESADISELVTVSKAARWEEGTRVYLEEGEQMSLWQLLQGLMVNSGNDAATAIADHIDGSKEKFAERMNAFVREQAGATHSQFKNPHGLPDPEHYTTAEDMAKIGKYAMRNAEFRELAGTKRVTWNGETWQTVLVNHNRLLGNYEGATGIKNGYTNAAGSTLVASAERDGLQLIAVILKAPTTNQLYKDMTALLDYGFAAFEPKLLFDENETYHMDNMPGVAYTAQEAIWTAVPKGERPKVLVDTTGVVRVLASNGVSEAGRFSVWRAKEDVKTLTSDTDAATKLAADATGEPPSGGAGQMWIAIMTCLIAAAGIGIYLFRLRQRKRDNMSQSL